MNRPVSSASEREKVVSLGPVSKEWGGVWFLVSIEIMDRPRRSVCV